MDSSHLVTLKKKGLSIATLVAIATDEDAIRAIESVVESFDYNGFIAPPIDGAATDEQTIKIYGASDDLIEIEGNAFEEEFGGPGWLLLSDGTVVNVYLDHEKGGWRIKAHRIGPNVRSIEVTQETDEEDDELINEFALIKASNIAWILRFDEEPSADLCSAPTPQQPATPAEAPAIPFT